MDLQTQKIFDGDVDIDVADRDEILSGLRHVDASIIKDVKRKHNVGVYFQSIPYNPLDNLSNIDYKEAEEMGYQKIDILNNSIYENVKSEEHLEQLVNTEPTWELFEHKAIVEKLFHIGNYASLVTRLKPKNVEELAMILAIIRPAKAHLQKENWDRIKQEVWKNVDEGYAFKRSHSYSYSVAIVVQLNLMLEGTV